MSKYVLQNTGKGVLGSPIKAHKFFLCTSVLVGTFLTFWTQNHSHYPSMSWYMVSTEVDPRVSPFSVVTWKDRLVAPSGKTAAFGFCFTGLFFHKLLHVGPMSLAEEPLEIAAGCPLVMESHGI